MCIYVVITGCKCLCEGELDISLISLRDNKDTTVCLKGIMKCPLQNLNCGLYREENKA
jgi:hypothetical protein